jgi:hypothetical protein
VWGVKKFLSTVLLSIMLIFVFTGCGFFTQPELGVAWNASGASTISTSQVPLSVRSYSLTVTLEFGGMWDANTVKSGKVTFGAVTSDQRIDLGDPTYNVTSGQYDTSTKVLTINCEEVTDKSKIILKGTVTNKTSISSGTITGSSSQIGTFNLEKQ